MSININCGPDLKQYQDRLRDVTKKLRKEKKISQFSMSEAMRYLIDAAYSTFFFEQEKKAVIEKHRKDIDKRMNGGDIVE